MKKFTLEGYKAYKESKIKSEVVPTSIPSLNEILGGGLRTRNFCVMIAGTGVGKTTTMMGFMLDVIEAGKKVAFLSIDEEDQFEVAERISCMHNRIKYERLISNSLSEEESQKIDDYIVGELAQKSEIYFSTDPFKVNKKEDIVDPTTGIVKKYKYERDIDIVIQDMLAKNIKYLFIDYLGAVIADEQAKMYSKLTEYSSILKATANDYNLMIFTAMQTNRDLKKAMKQTDFDATLVDESYMADSIGPARKATICFSLVKPQGKPATLNVFKNRLNGRIGSIDIKIDPLSLRWDEFYDFEA